MDEHEWLAEQFEAYRTHLRAVAYRMLGSQTEADDAVQESWLRLSRSDTGGVENLGGWLTTVVARVCLDTLRSRTSRREEPLGAHVPDPIVGRGDKFDPEHQSLLAESVGLALLVVLETLAPAERLAVLDPDVVLRLDRGAVPPGASREVRGASAVAGLGFSFSGAGWLAQPALVNGAAGVVMSRGGRPFSVIGFTVRHGKIVAIDI